MIKLSDICSLTKHKSVSLLHVHILIYTHKQCFGMDYTCLFDLCICCAKHIGFIIDTVSSVYFREKIMDSTKIKHIKCYEI